jgi:hypothetical protein
VSPIGKELLERCEVRDHCIIVDCVDSMTDEELEYAIKLGMWCFP